MAMAEAVPTTPGIREIRSESGSESFGFCVGSPPGPGIRRVSLRAEIDTSPPFGSVQEAVTRFGGRGSWNPFYKLGDSYNVTEEFDLKKAEEQAAELEKDIIVKELETLDVLEALGSTKRVVEDLKRQLQQEALKCMATPDFHSDIKEMNEDHYKNLPPSHDPVAGNSSPYLTSSPDMILMELKQAKMNLGKSINDLVVIQTSVESLNTKLKKEKSFLEKNIKRLTSEFAGAVSLAEELKQMRMKPQVLDDGIQKSPRVLRENFQMTPPQEQVKRVAETMGSGNEWDNSYLRTAEMRLIAARKMEEAARAAEALAFAEMKALSESNENCPEFLLPEPPPRSPLTPKALKKDELSTERVLNAMHQLSEPNIFKVAVLRKMEEATEEVKQSKQALEQALNRMEIANRKQLAAELAFRRWMPGNDQKGHATKNATKPNNFHLSGENKGSFLSHLNKQEPVNDDPKPMLKPTVSMRDVLSQKQVPNNEEFVPGRQSEGRAVRRNVNLSQMLNELKGDLKYPTRPEKDGNDEKQFLAQRKKFGFIHISLPKQTKKKQQPLNLI